MKANIEKKKTGRPTKYTDEAVDKICYLIATSKHGLHRILNDNPELPKFRTVFDWLMKEEYESFRTKYARAREAQQDFFGEEIIHISDDDSEDEIFIESEDGSGQSAKRVMNNEFVQRSKLRVETRKWLMSKLAPKKYGDKLDVTSDGNSIAPVTIVAVNQETVNEINKLK